MVADRLRSLLRPADFAARLGGDEFIVCCADLDADATAATRAAELISARIVDAVAEPFEAGGRRWQIGASVGTALSRAGELSPAELLRRADSEMYRVKAAR
jgi:diguanylate cyclase (GGDEF)-like protein